MTIGSLMKVESIAECSKGEIGKTKIFMTNGSLMKVESIAECSKGEHSAILSTCIKRLISLEWPTKTGFFLLYFLVHN